MLTGASIRRMTLADVSAVQAIEQATFATPWTEADFVREMTENRCARYLVAEADGCVIGYAGAWCILDEGHVTNIAVTRSRRGQGVGGELLNRLMRYAANLGVQYLTLEVRRGNAVAQALYQKAGFQSVGVRKRYYEDNGEDALLMVCDRMPSPDPDFSEPETVTESGGPYED